MTRWWCLAALLFVIEGGVAWPATCRTVSIPSASMRRKLKASIVLPDSYRSSGRKYSVVYLLHGYSRDYRSWRQMVPLPAYADQYQLIFVCPDGGYASWYLDSRVKKRSLFETFVSREAVAYVDAKFRTHSHFQGRAIIGSSMGGHGALTVLAKHPGVFCGAGSISGIMELAEFRDRWEIVRVLGPFESHAQSWKEASFIHLLSRISDSGRTIILDCGLDDFALPGNRRAHQSMVDLGIAHEYFERPGGHSPAYVRSCAEYHIEYFRKVLLPPG